MSSPREQDRRPLRGWGRATTSHARVTAPAGDDGWAEALARAGPRGVIARGAGRGYGDAAQNAGGLVAFTSAQRAIGPIDSETATVWADAGASIGSLLRLLAPLGWTLPVVPGTAAVTVGGAIAADVHGKNHPHRGSFGTQVAEMAVLTPALGPVRMGPDRDPDAFWTTVGGLGLTGIIRRARLRIVPLDSWWVRVVDTVATDLPSVLLGLRDAAAHHEHAVAWLDPHRDGRKLGAGVVSRATPVAGHDGARRPRHADFGHGVAVPRLPGRGIAWPPVSAAAHRLRMAAARARPGRRLPLTAMHFPLDTVPGWVGLHGRHGLIQHQFTVPFGAEDVLADALATTRAAGYPPSLAVLKVFGAADPAPLSFPQPGWSLAMDFAAHPGLGPVLDRLDERVATAGGRVYLVKDSRLRPDLLARMYPGLARWRAERDVLDPDGVMTSDLARRLRLTGLVGAVHA